jgi:hypothetical protein
MMTEGLPPIDPVLLEAEQVMIDLIYERGGDSKARSLAKMNAPRLVDFRCEPKRHVLATVYVSRSGPLFVSGAFLDLRMFGLPPIDYRPIATSIGNIRPSRGRMPYPDLPMRPLTPGCLYIAPRWQCSCRSWIGPTREEIAAKVRFVLQHKNVRRPVDVIVSASPK